MSKRTFLCSVVLIFCALPSASLAQYYTGKLGYGVSPLGHPADFSKFDEFLAEVAQQCDGGVVFANSAWRDSLAASGTIPGLQRTIATLQPEQYAYTDMVNFGWRRGSTLLLDVPGEATNNWTNTTARSLFLQMLINAADSLAPAYLFVGNEINFYWQQDTTDFLNWVEFYEQAYDSIKAHAPATKVGTVFNFESMAGTGVLNGWTQSYWGALEAFNLSKLDVVGVTVYPFLGYATANEVPPTYLDPFFSRIGNTPVVITETGWPGDSLIGVWHSSPEEQVDYVYRLFSMIDGKNVEVVNWLYLNYLRDTSTVDLKIFASVALRDWTGNDRPALGAWLAQCSIPTSVTATEGRQPFKLRAYPNPFTSSAVIESGTALRNGELRLYNILGQEVQRLGHLNGTRFTVTRGTLPTGIYFYGLYERARLLGSGRLLIR